MPYDPEAAYNPVRINFYVELSEPVTGQTEVELIDLFELEKAGHIDFTIGEYTYSYGPYSSTNEAGSIIILTAEGVAARNANRAHYSYAFWAETRLIEEYLGYLSIVLDGDISVPGIPYK